MSNYSERLTRSIVSEDGTFKWSPDLRDRGQLKGQATIGDLALDLCADLNPYSEPFVSFREHTEGLEKKPKFDVLLGVLETIDLQVNETQNGYIVPLPVLGGVEVHVDDEWGYRKYLVPDADDGQVTYAPWQNDNVATGQAGHFADHVSVSEQDAQAIRELVDGLLPLTDSLAA